MAISYIYGVTSKVHDNKIVYVGKCLSRPLSYRTGCQFRDALRYNRRGRFSVAIRKYGSDNFKYVVLEEVVEPKFLNHKEREYIKLHGTYKNGYNMTKGGDGGKDTKNVAKYNNAGELLDTYSSVNEAATINGVFASNISMCANGGNCPRIRGFRYRYFIETPRKTIEEYRHPLKGRKRVRLA